MGSTGDDAALIELQYDEGTVTLQGSACTVEKLKADASEANPSPGFDLDLEFDPRTESLRIPAYRYADLVTTISRTDVAFHADDRVLSIDRLPPVASGYDLREYQQSALDQWYETDSWSASTPSNSRTATGNPNTPIPAAPRGVVEMPTGSGKTVVALAAIERLRTPTLIVVPTIDLLDQWSAELEREFDVPVGRFGGGEQRREPITVSTYDSAYLKASSIGDRFGFVVFDEVHHLGGEGYRDIARLLAAPARLGLTATFERPDDAHERIEDLVGPVVYRIDAGELAGEHLAPYDVKRIEVSLTEDEREEYERDQSVFTSYLARSNITLRTGSDYQKLVMRSGSDPAAREALLARQRARKIMLGSEAKLDALESILDTHRDDRIIVFTAHNDLVYDVAERFLIPPITHRTAAAERREILDRFRSGTYSRVVSGNVLDEGVDVPDASVAVVLSGSGSEREFTQRLGRILRPKADGGRAILYEVVSEETGEERVADRRR